MVLEVLLKMRVGVVLWNMRIWVGFGEVAGWVG